MNAAEKRKLAAFLKPYRAEERKAQVATIADSRDAIRLLPAWGACRKDWRPSGKAPRDSDERWRWLWCSVWFDVEELAALLGTSEKQAERTLRVCFGLRVIYPDGTMTKHAKALVEDYGRAKRPGTTKGRPVGSKDKTKRATRGSKDD